jgi:DNA-binding transcriptional MerR regulator
MTTPITVSRLGRELGISRTTLLYYERLGLLVPARRSRAGYRLYGEAELGRLREIRRLRRAGVPLRSIARAIGSPRTLAETLRDRLDALRSEMDALREQQRVVIGLLRTDGVREAAGAVTKGRWVALLRAAGFSPRDLRAWHADFERHAPKEHQRFLEQLGIPASERRAIRARARAFADETPARRSGTKPARGAARASKDAR